MSADVDSDRKKLEDRVLNERIARKARKIVEREEQGKAPELIVRRASDIKIERLEKVFGGRFVVGTLTIGFGPGEVGKGMLLADIAARMTTGEPFPGENGIWRPPIDVLFVTVEDSVERITARLMAAGADLNRVCFLNGPPVIRGGLIIPHTPMMLDSDAGGVLKIAKQENAKALFLETMVEHIGDREGKIRVSTNNEAEVRRALSPFRAICQEGRLIGFGIMHPRKGTEGSADEAIGGSIAFRNVARSTIAVYSDPTDDSDDRWRLFASGKASYLHHRPPTLRFRVEPWEKDPDEGHVVWGIEGKSLVDERDLDDIWSDIREKQKANRKRGDHAVIKAEEFLREFLAGGIRTFEEISLEAITRKIHEKTLKRAKSNLGIETLKEGFPARVIGWQFPKSEV